MKKKTSFDWDRSKNKENQNKHVVSFEIAQYAFTDPNRVILKDISHSTESEERFYCVGKIDNDILTVRFTCRDNTIRIFGAGFWRKGKKIYEQQK